VVEGLNGNARRAARGDELDGFALVGWGIGPLGVAVIAVIIIGFNVRRSGRWGRGLGGLAWWKYSRYVCGS